MRFFLRQAKTSPTLEEREEQEVTREGELLSTHGWGTCPGVCGAVGAVGAVAEVAEVEIAFGDVFL